MDTPDEFLISLKSSRAVSSQTPKPTRKQVRGAVSYGNLICIYEVCIHVYMRLVYIGGRREGRRGHSYMLRLTSLVDRSTWCRFFLCDVAGECARMTLLI